MNRTTRMLLSTAMIAPLFLAIVPSVPAAPSATRPEPVSTATAGKPLRDAGGPQDRAAAETVVEVLAGRIGDPVTADRLRRKLPHLTAREQRLAVALCERIMDKGARSAGAEIAFSLLTALIVLS